MAADDEHQGHVRRMDLNLYLGLPHLFRQNEIDLGSDLSLGSLPVLVGEDFHASSTEMSSFTDARDSHVPYSPSHASYSQNPQVTESLAPSENSPSHPTVLLSTQPQESQEHEEGSQLEYGPYSPSYSPAYSLSYVPDGYVEQNSSEIMTHGASNHLEYVPYSPYVPPFFSPSEQASGPLDQEASLHVPYIPSFPTTAEYNVGTNVSEVMGFGPHEITTEIRETSVEDSSLRREALIRRWIRSARRQRVRRLRSIFPVSMGIPSSASAFPNHITESEGPTETNSGTCKTRVEGLIEESEEETAARQSILAANFDCNICLDVAKEPVVTSCGHLFCWPCLYQWLHHHCDHKECPVCKGEVVESKVIPIYGRGNAELGVENKGCEHEDSGMKIPPRPRGCRIESLRQRRRRPFWRRLGERNNFWRQLADEGRHNENRLNGQEEQRGQRTFDDWRQFVDEEQRNENRLNSLNSSEDQTRRRILDDILQQYFRRERHNENGLNRQEEQGEQRIFVGPNPLGLNRSMVDGRNHTWDNNENVMNLESVSSARSAPEMALSNTEINNSGSNGHHEGGSRVTGETLTLVGTIAQSHNSGHRNSHRNMEIVVSADQASASSTMAVIHGDAGVPVDASTETDSMGSSRTLGRRRNRASGSLDVDEGFHHARKRRRLN